VYGVNTGFGELKNRHIEPAHLADLQRNLLRSHAAGVGDPMPTDAVRTMGLLRAGHSPSACPACAKRCALVALLNAGVHPIVPEQVRWARAAIWLACALRAGPDGEGEAECQGHRLPGGEALARAGLQPLTLEAKEGLGLINGTQQSTVISRSRSPTRRSSWKRRRPPRP
jgi:histidine ammonia-lyase